MFKKSSPSQQQKREDVKRFSSAMRARTMGRDKGAQFSYSLRLALVFLLIAAITILILVAVLAVVWENQFQIYTRKSMEDIARHAAVTLAQKYDIHNEWSPSMANEVRAISNLSGGMGIEVLDKEGAVVIDSTWPSNTSSNTYPIPGFAPNDTSSVVEESIVSDRTGNTLGTVRVWAYGSDFYLTKKDIDFRRSSYVAIGIAAIVAALLSIALGLIFSQGLVRPIRRISNAASRIKDGDLTARANLKGQDEIAYLGATFDAMAQSIENDRELERRLTADVAHELRTPLMAIQSTVEAIQDGVFPADSERLATISAETRRLARLVEALLQLSRLESGATQFVFRQYNVIDLIHNIAVSHEALARDHEMRLVFQNMSGAPMLMAEVDPDRLRQAIINLVSNAVRYSEAGGLITLSVALENKGKSYVIAVSDEGVGIQPKDLSRIFSRFWRAEQSRTRATGGLGIGLTVTQEIVDRHQGYIEVSSEVGVGTTFELHLPVKLADKTGGEHSLLSLEAHQALEKPKHHPGDDLIG